MIFSLKLRFWPKRGFADQDVPVLVDRDPDFDAHWSRFLTVVQTHTLGKRKVPDMELLVVYRRCFPEGSIRLLIFDTHMNEATRINRLPEEAAQVMKEVKAELRNAIIETIFQRRNRLEAEFAALDMKSCRIRCPFVYEDGSCLPPVVSPAPSVSVAFEGQFRAEGADAYVPVPRQAGGFSGWREGTLGHSGELSVPH